VRKQSFDYCMNIKGTINKKLGVGKL